MNLGKKIRMQRLFSHPTGRFLSVAFDHFLGYGLGMPEGLRTIQATIDKIAEGVPDAVTVYKGVAVSAWGPHAGKIPLILQSITGRPDIPHLQQLIHPEEAVKLGADAIAVSMFLKGANETDALRILADTVFEASRYDLPVITHVYPRLFDAQGNPYISTEPEDIAYVVRCGIEAGADVVKVPYCGDIVSYGQIVSDSTVPIVAAGGPKTTTMLEALQMMEDVIKAGALGATVGRNIWGNSQVIENVLAYKAVIHDFMSPEEAVRKYRLE